jgi:hypothetical protein
LIQALSKRKFKKERKLTDNESSFAEVLATALGIIPSKLLFY